MLVRKEKFSKQSVRRDIAHPLANDVNILWDSRNGSYRFIYQHLINP